MQIFADFAHTFKSKSSTKQPQRIKSNNRAEKHCEFIAPTIPLTPGGDLSLPLQHCRETGGCSELTYLMAQECWLAASIPPSILLA